MRSEFVALGGASFYSERARAQRGQGSEEVKNREGVASGSATQILRLICKNINQIVNKILTFASNEYALVEISAIENCWIVSSEFSSD